MVELEQQYVTLEKNLLHRRNQGIGVFIGGILTFLGASSFMETARMDALPEGEQKIIVGIAIAGMVGFLGSTGWVSGIEGRIQRERLKFLEEDRKRQFQPSDQSIIRRS